MRPSFADTSFYVALASPRDALGMSEALTSDFHFEQAGFKACLI